MEFFTAPLYFYMSGNVQSVIPSPPPVAPTDGMRACATKRPISHHSRQPLCFAQLHPMRVFAIYSVTFKRNPVNASEKKFDSQCIYVLLSL